ncbi:putative protein phosphatase 2C 75-like [Dorcoceras hygrometricum]|uniref:Reverse transcriptase domain-containing protein n=1 Tax=Dorcoceras hygrometricum TaxID=472368 RepID=A0A2Z7A9S8_9LAMI|nr:putative protein phosphatase 2C 75-like [Dorcoceras hygrometricum]
MTKDTVTQLGLRRMSSSPRFRFHPLCEFHRITHLTYVDDLLLFSRGDYENVQSLVEHLFKNHILPVWTSGRFAD